MNDNNQKEKEDDNIDKIDIANKRMFVLGMANVVAFNITMVTMIAIIIVCNIYIQNAIVLQLVAAIVSQFATASQSNAQLVNNYYFGSSPGARANTSAVTDGVKKIFDSFKKNNND